MSDTFEDDDQRTDGRSAEDTMSSSNQHSVLHERFCKMPREEVLGVLGESLAKALLDDDVFLRDLNDGGNRPLNGVGVRFGEPGCGHALASAVPGLELPFHGDHTFKPIRQWATM